MSVRLLLTALAGWLNRQQNETITYLIAENRILRGQLRGRRLRLTDVNGAGWRCTGTGWAVEGCAR